MMQMDQFMVYEVTEGLKANFDALQDNLSKDIFFARLRYEIEQTMTSAMQLSSFRNRFRSEKTRERLNWKSEYQALQANEKRIVLYGTGTIGREIAKLLLADGLDFYTFCGRRFSAYPNGLMEKPVIAPA